MRKIELLTLLREYLIEQYSGGRRVLIVIDEAQNLSRKVLEEIRLLSGVIWPVSPSSGRHSTHRVLSS